MNCQNNSEILKKTNPDIVKKIEKSSSQDWIQIINAKYNKKNLLVKKGKNTVLAYPEDNPVALSKQISQTDIFHKDTVTILLGLGLGHLAHALLKKKHKDHKIIVIEPVMQLFKESFTIYDFSKWIEDGTLYFATTKKEIDYIVHALDSVFVIQDWIFIGELYTNYCEEYFDLSSYAIEIINRLKCNTGTIMGAGSIIAENDIKNLPYIIRHRGINELKDIFKNKPAVLVSTGPSLQKNIHLLKDIQDQVVIIAVAQALRVLLAYDIKPDFIGTVDYGEVNLEHFKGLMDSEVPLICLNRTYADILKQWKGTKFIVSSTMEDPNDTVQGFIAKNKGSIPQGGSVSHFIFSTAIHMGCNPIVLMGLDLSYPNKFDSHIKLADARGQIQIDAGVIKWKINDPQSSLDELIMGNEIYIPGYFEKDVLTNVGLASFVTSFDSMFEVNKDKEIIDATEGGAKKKNTNRMTLQKFIDTKLERNIIDKSIIRNFSSLCGNADKLIEDVIPIIEKDIEILDDIIDNSENGLDTCDKMLIEDDNRKLKKLLKENEEYSNAAHAAAKKNNLVAVSIYDTNRKIYNRELYVNGKVNHLLKNKDDFEIRVERNKMILEAAKKASEHLKPLYEEALEILTSNDESLLSSDIVENIDLEYADKYLEVGNWAHPLLTCRKLMESDIDIPKATASKIPRIFKQSVLMREQAIEQAKGDYANNKDQDILDYNEFVESAQTIGRETRDFGKAIIMLKKAVDLNVGEFEALWGLATAYHHIGDIDNAIIYYEKLIENFPKVKRFKFEYGQVLLQKDFDTGMEYLLDVMESTSEFNYFYCRIGDLYRKIDIEKSIIYYKKYLDEFNSDYDVWERLRNCYIEQDNQKEVNKINKKHWKNLP